LTAVLTGDRALLTSRAAALVRERLVLHPSDSGDYALAGLPRHSRADDTVPGRGLFAVPDHRVVEVQLAVLGDDPSGRAQAGELARLAENCRHADRRAAAGRRASADANAAADPDDLAPLRVRPLPPSLSVHSLEPRPSGPLWTPIGVGGDDARAVGLELAAGGLLVAGPPGSGRSTALAAVVAWHLGRGAEVAVVAPPRSPLTGTDTLVVHPDDGEGVDRFLGAPGERPRIVVVDDAPQLLDSPVDRALTAHLTTAPDARTAVVASGEVDALQATFRGLTVPLRHGRQGVLLCPHGPLDGELLGVHLPRRGGTRPGRGFLVDRGRVCAVQVACP
jgi:S-DNA-T family DNA segregation ATPase FtsK/SpoIIIE